MNAPIPRLQLFEFNDQSWLPSVLRDGLTGYLEALSRTLGFHRRMAPVIERALKRSGADRLIDLCSGSGGPILQIRKLLSRPVPVLLTDKYPNRAVFESVTGGDVRAHLSPVDATAVPDELSGLRTMINALHHFPPHVARKILEDAVAREQPLIVIELPDRRAFTILSAPLLIPSVYLLVPMFRPMRWQFLALTYVIPVLPLMIGWDGLISHLRAYTVAELRSMADGLNERGYTWDIERIPLGIGLHATVLVGLSGTYPDG